MDTDQVGQGPIQILNGGGHLLGQRLPQPRRPLDVGPEQCHRTRRQKAVHALIAPFHRVNFAHANQHR